jgi:hypothetical protein
MWVLRWYSNEATVLKSIDKQLDEVETEVGGEHHIDIVHQN